jgi:hypothetical protein
VGGVVDGRLDAVRGTVGPVQLDGEGLGLRVESEGALGAVDAHLVNVEPGGVEDQGVEPGQEGRQGVGGGAGDAPGVPIEREVELQVLEVILPRRHVAGRRALGRERLALGDRRQGRQKKK